MQNQKAQDSPPAFVDMHHAPELPDRRARLAAGALTSSLYALFAVLIWHSFLIAPLSPEAPEITATVLPDVQKQEPPLPPPIQVHLVRPHVDNIVVPAFTVQIPKSLAPAPLPPTAVDVSTVAAGGTATGNDTGGSGQAGPGAVAGGKNGNRAACYDPAWLHAVTRRVTRLLSDPGPSGYVIIHFTVRGSGQLDLVEISRSSGNQTLDNSAYKAMRAADPLPPIPSSMHTERFDDYYEMDFGDEAHLHRSFNYCSG